MTLEHDSYMIVYTAVYRLIHDREKYPVVGNMWISVYMMCRMIILFVL